MIPYKKYFLKKMGFSLTEILLVILIISIFATLGHRLYQHQAMKTYRYQAKIALLQLAVQLEHYYQEQFTYEGVTLEKLQIFSIIDVSHYEMKLVKLERDHFFIQAHPLGFQKGDVECGSLGLDNVGRKHITGTGSISNCWL